MANFLLLIDDIIKYSKKEIDQGRTPPKIYEICNCIRETFCLSYAIRKDNNLFLFYEENGILIKFFGENLRFLGPDERSQTLLLKKALEVSEKFIGSRDCEWQESTPGIYVRKFYSNNSFINYFCLTFLNNIFLIIRSDYIKENELNLNLEKIEKINAANSDLFIIPTFNFLKKKRYLYHMFKGLNKVKLKVSSKLNATEDIILYINFQLDRKQ